MTHFDTDILVSGGGIAGLTAAAAFGAAGFCVLCVDPVPPMTAENDPASDQRSTAFLQPARAFLERAGLWEALSPHATPLQTMRIVDAGGTDGTARVIRDFDASNISDAPFAWNLPNWRLRREILSRLDDLDNVRFLSGVGAAGLVSRLDHALVRLSDGQQASARLVLAADGRNSPLRRAAGIGAKTIRFGQKALAFSVTHPIPHQNISTEIHQTGGPFTLVPLPDLDDRPRSAVVWMDHGPNAQDLMAMAPADFEARMSERSCHILGPLSLASHRALWPIIAQKAARLTEGRLALVAEAAHVVPPIGAQGLNMSLRDLACLLDLARAQPDRLGAPEMMAAYQRARWPDISTRIAGITALNRASMAHLPMMRDARAWALNALHGAGPVRRGLMHLGLGTGTAARRSG